MKHLRLLVIVCSIGLLAACGGLSQPEQAKIKTGPDTNHVGEFSAVNQAGEDFNVTDLKGQWWVVDFVFTNCTTVCLPMTANMTSLQKKLADAGLEDVQLVSFSVDPDRDTPEVLTAYAEEYGADLENWTFVTGYDFNTIRDYSITTFKNLIEPPPEGDDQVTHGTAFFLVNPEGEIVSHYSGTKADQMDQIVNDIKNWK